MKYSDLDDGQSSLLFATGVPPQEHLDDIGYKDKTSNELHKEFIDSLEDEDGNP